MVTVMDTYGSNVEDLSDEELVQAARWQHQDDGVLEVDDNAVVSRGAVDGAYVQAWVWVQCKQPEED